MNSNTNLKFKNKYLKYKQKYFELKLLSEKISNKIINTNNQSNQSNQSNKRNPYNKRNKIIKKNQKGGVLDYEFSFYFQIDIGQEGGEEINPNDIAVGLNYVVILDIANNKILIFDRLGNYLSNLIPEDFSENSKIDILGDLVYFVANNRVYEYNIQDLNNIVLQEIISVDNNILDISISFTKLYILDNGIGYGGIKVYNLEESRIQTNIYFEQVHMVTGSSSISYLLDEETGNDYLIMVSRNRILSYCLETRRLAYLNGEYYPSVTIDNNNNIFVPIVHEGINVLAHNSIYVYNKNLQEITNFGGYEMSVNDGGLTDNIKAIYVVNNYVNNDLYIIDDNIVLVYTNNNDELNTGFIEDTTFSEVSGMPRLDIADFTDYFVFDSSFNYDDNIFSGDYLDVSQNYIILSNRPGISRESGTPLDINIFNLQGEYINTINNIVNDSQGNSISFKIIGNELYVGSISSSSPSSITRYNINTGNLISEINEIQQIQPRNIIPLDISEKNDEIYILNRGNNKIVVLENDLVFIREIDFNYNSSSYWSESQLITPTKFNIYDNLIILISNRKIKISSIDSGAVIRNMVLDDDDEFTFVNLTVYRNIIFITCTDSYIRLYNFNLQIIKKVGGLGSSLGKLDEPRGIKIFNDKLYVCDDGNERVQIFNIQSTVGSGQIYMESQGIYDNYGNWDYFNEEETKEEEEEIKEEQDLSLVRIYNLIMGDINSNPLGTGGNITNLFFIEKTGNVIPEMSFSYTENSIIHDEDGNMIANITKNINIFTQLYSHRSAIIGNKEPVIGFVNYVTKIRQSGFDLGGLTKTVFLRLSELFAKPSFKYFNIDSETNLVTLKNLTPKEIQDPNTLDEINFLGKLFARAIRLKQQILIDLDPFLLYQMGNDDFFNLNPEEIKQIIREYDPKLFNYRPYKCFEEAAWNIDSTCQYTENHSGDIVESDITNKDIDTAQKIKKIFSDDNILPLYNAFIDGFKKEFIGIRFLRKQPVRLLDMLIVGDRELTLDKVLNAIEFIGFDSSPGNNQVKFMKQIIIGNYQDAGSSQEYIEKLLELITGTSRMPAGGYPPNKKISIRLTDTDKEPYDIHTCFNYIEINKNIFLEVFKNRFGTSTSGLVVSGLNMSGISKLVPSTSSNNFNIKSNPLYISFSLNSIDIILSAGFLSA